MPAARDATLPGGINRFATPIYARLEEAEARVWL